jgi:hypothetical protein
MLSAEPIYNWMEENIFFLHFLRFNRHFAVNSSLRLNSYNEIFLFLFVFFLLRSRIKKLQRKKGFMKKKYCVYKVERSKCSLIDLFMLETHLLFFHCSPRWCWNISARKQMYSLMFFIRNKLILFSLPLTSIFFLTKILFLVCLRLNFTFLHLQI